MKNRMDRNRGIKAITEGVIVKSSTNLTFSLAKKYSAGYNKNERSLEKTNRDLC